jgi:hypothetical protein
MGRNIEVTPEMVEAGKREFSLASEASYSPPPHLGDVLAAVYIAMVRNDPSQRQRTSQRALNDRTSAK